MRAASVVHSGVASCVGVVESAELSAGSAGLECGRWVAAGEDPADAEDGDAEDDEDDDDDDDDEDEDGDEDGDDAGAPPRAASRLNGVLEAPLGDALVLVAPARLGAPAAAGLSLSAGIEGAGPRTLRALVRLTLLLAILCAQLLVLASLHDAVDHLGALRGLLPLGAVRVALVARAPHDLFLLLDRLGKAGQEGLELAQARASHPILGATREFARVARLVVLELLKLGLALSHTPLPRRESLCALPLLLVRYALRRP